MAFYANSFIWTVYGFTQGETIVFLQNFMSLCLSVYSLYIFFMMKREGDPKIELRPSFLDSLVWPFIAFWTCLMIVLILMVRNLMLWPSTLGEIGAVMAIVQFASPMAVMGQVLIQGYTGGLVDMPLSILLLLMGLLWTVYGILISDSNIILPNFIGSVLAALQIFIVYTTPPTRDGWPVCRDNACCQHAEPAALSPKLQD